jgi:hypothetical protein
MLFTNINKIKINKYKQTNKYKRRIIMTITASDFHSLYNNAFKFSDSAKAQIQDEIPNLLLIDSTNREGKILEALTNIRAILAKGMKGQDDNPLLFDLKQSSGTIPNSDKFWGMFSRKVPFETHTATTIRNLFLSRIKPLQDELQKLGIKDKAALQDFFENPDYFKKQPLAQPQPGYYKPGADGHMNVMHAKRVEGPSIPSNWYSEEELDQSLPEIASQVRNIRDGFTARAVAGELIREKIMVDNGKDGQSRSTILLTPYNPKTEAMYPYPITMNALIYHEIKNGRIKSKKEAYTYALQQITTNPLFNLYSATQEVNQMTIMEACFKSINQFNKAFEKLAKDAELATGMQIS